MGGETWWGFGSMRARALFLQVVHSARAPASHQSNTCGAAPLGLPSRPPPRRSPFSPTGTDRYVYRRLLLFRTAPRGRARWRPARGGKATCLRREANGALGRAGHRRHPLCQRGGPQQTGLGAHHDSCGGGKARECPLTPRCRALYPPPTRVIRCRLRAWEPRRRAPRTFVRSGRIWRTTHEHLERVVHR